MLQRVLMDGLPDEAPRYTVTVPYALLEGTPDLRSLAGGVGLAGLADFQWRELDDESGIEVRVWATDEHAAELSATLMPLIVAVEEWRRRRS